MIIVFIGPPFAGKGTQVSLLGKKLGLPVFSMGAIIREEYKAGNPKAIEGFEKYSMKGFHLPIELKFDLLKERLEKAPNGFILDHFPATQEDLDAFNKYLDSKGFHTDRAFYLFVSEDEMKKRIITRERADDNPEIIMKRREIQDKDRIPVVTYFRDKGILEEVDGGRSVKEVHRDILNRLGVNN
ncbi:MAG: nucleoside monophosphate kinase [Candidatus Levybacteria bacterium]|nr:nucleoside monophosphate kinase [Candidatus Levybacteria bacterium]MBI2622930.1 nucleoside monophosphate kinase [Candidatus Levybacteria bacterium]MBI3070253.1 nucleoside monophosphate kinase [Candidatus Levybacteria bacterium]MBI3093008.1 nucleoside monophosphate kinase [Candidatus Levybacteria bacterium]